MGTGSRHLRLAVTPMALAAAGALHAQATSNAFNPAISMILDGKFSAYSTDMEEYEFGGFPLGGEAGPPSEGFSLGESELVLSANIDDSFHGFVTVALEQEGGETEVELEEAWVQTLSLPAGLSVKAGRFYSDIGYHNPRHPHTWDFVDAPLAYLAMMGGNLSDTGMQLRWLPAADLMVELGAEVFRGESYPAAGGSDGAGAWTAFARVGGDLGVTQSWRAGVSYLSADVAGREWELEDALGLFDGDGSVVGLDLVWKWAENGNPRQRNVVVQAELLMREEQGQLAVAGELPVGASAYDLSQTGVYLQGVYQFVPRWRAGLRYDRISADNGALAGSLGGLLDSADDPSRWSAMVDYSHSEFSRLRLQFSSLDLDGSRESQVFLQYIMSLGAHGSHQF